MKDAEPLDEAQVNVLLTIGHCDGGPKLLARVTRRAHRLLRLGPGQDLYAQIKAVSLIGSSDGRPGDGTTTKRGGAIFESWNGPRFSGAP